MQVLHPTSAGLYTGITNAVSTIYRIEGWRTLWKGVSSVIVGAGTYIHDIWGKWEMGMAKTWQVLPTLSISVHTRRSRSLQVEMRMVIIRLLLVILFPEMCRRRVLMFVALSGACATIASDALMNPFDGMLASQFRFRHTNLNSHQAAHAGPRIRPQVNCAMCQNSLSSRRSPGILRLVPDHPQHDSPVHSHAIRRLRVDIENHEPVQRV